MPRPHLSDHQKLAQARAEIARLRKTAEAKAGPLTDATRRKLESELMKVKLENYRLREQLAAKAHAPASSGEIALLRLAVKLQGGDCRQARTRQEGAKEDSQEGAQEGARLTLLHRLPRRHDLDLRRLAATGARPRSVFARCCQPAFAADTSKIDALDAGGGH